MKQDIVPTSPKILRPKRESSPSVFIVILLSFLFGTASGAGVYFLLQSDRFLEKAETLIIREAQQDNQKDQIQKWLDRVRGTMAQANEFPALILTSDGWVVAEASSATTIEYQKETFPVEKTFFDASSDLTFYKIKGTNFLPVQFSDPEDRGVGLSAVFVKPARNPALRDNDAGGPGWEIKISYLRTRDTFDEQLPGSLTFTWSGELLGMTRSDGNFVWSEDISKILTKLLTEASMDDTVRRLF